MKPPDVLSLLIKNHIQIHVTCASTECALLSMSHSDHFNLWIWKKETLGDKRSHSKYLKLCTYRLLISKWSTYEHIGGMITQLLANQSSILFYTSNSTCFPWFKLIQWLKKAHLYLPETVLQCCHCVTLPLHGRQSGTRFIGLSGNQRGKYCCFAHWELRSACFEWELLHGRMSPER